MRNGTNVYNPNKYASFARESYTFKYIEWPTIKRVLKGLVDKKTKIVEAGCGEGRLIKYLEKVGVRAENVLGIDVSQELLEIAQKEIPKAKFICARIGSNIETIKDFDLVISSMVLDYLDRSELEGFFANSYEWLMKDGYLLYLIPHPVRMVSEDLSLYFDRKRRLRRTPWGDEVKYFHRTVSDYINLTIKSGFEVVEVLEPEVDKEGMKDKEKYQKYSQFPVRLAVLARKK